MTVGQVAAGSTGLDPKTAFASAPGRLGSNPKSELEFLGPAQANGKPFSFHLRAKSDGASVNEGPRERETSRHGGAYGTSQDEEPPTVPPPGEDTELTASPLDSTALETARSIIARLQAPPRAPGDAVKTTPDGQATADNRSAALDAPFGDLEKPGDVSQTTAFQKLESLRHAAMPIAAIEHAELGLLDSDGIPPGRIGEQGLGLTFFGRGASDPSPDIATSTGQPPATPENQPATGTAVPADARMFTIRGTSVANSGAALPLRATIEHAELGLVDSDGIPPSRIAEQGLGRTFLGRGPSNPSPDLAAPARPTPATSENQPNPVENLRAIAATEDAVRVNARALTIRSTNVTNAAGAQEMLPSRVVASAPGKVTQHYLDPNHPGGNQQSGKEVEPVEQATVTDSPMSRLRHEVSHEKQAISNLLTVSYLNNRILPLNNPSVGVSDTAARSEQSPERKAEQANIPSTRPRPDSRLAHLEVPMGPQGNAAVKAASLPVSAAHFSLRPSETHGDEGIGAGSLSRRFSTGNPQTAAAHSPTGAELKAANEASGPQPIDTASSQHPRTLHANAAEFTRTGANLVSSSLRAPSSGGASLAEPLPPTQHAAPEVARHNEGRTPSPMASKAPAVSEFTRTDANLVSPSHSAVALAAVVRQARGDRNGPSGTEFTRTQKGLDSPEQSKSQPALPVAPFSKRGTPASRENELGSSVRNGHSGSAKSNLSNKIAVPAVRRSANDTADPASQTLPRPAESSPRAAEVFSRPAGSNSRAQASYSEQVRAVERVVELASLQKSADLNQMNVVLRDSHLGRLSLRLVERNGVIDTLMRTDNARTGQLIGESLPQMLESLSQKGFNVSHSGSEQWTGSQQDQRQGGRQRPPRPASRQGRRGPGAERVFRLEIDS